jgi:hypothetical protein
MVSLGILIRANVAFRIPLAEINIETVDKVNKAA